MAALILPGQYASWQTGLIEAFIPERTLGDYTVAGGMLKSMSMQGPAVTITGNQHLYKRLATGFNYPLTIVVVHRQIVASPSRVMASVGAGTNRHLLYLSSSGGVSMYSGSSGGGVQAAGAGTVAGSINFSAGRVAASNYRDVFINGQFSAPNTGNIITGPQNTFAIGAYWNNDAAATNFYSDEEVLFAGLWNRALSNNELLSLYSSWEPARRPKRQTIYFLPANTGGGSGTTYTIVPSGNVSFSGNVTTTTTQNINPSGNILFSGNAPLSFTGAASSFTMIPSGAVVLDGISTFARGSVFTTGGTLSFSGTTVSNIGYQINPSGDFTLAGEAVISKGMVVQPSGSVQFIGGAPISSNTVVETNNVTKLPLTFAGKT